MDTLELLTGTIIAGVLRGERARFQLFGDSVNTTARIESTGLPDQIHISEQTAQELTKREKSDWFIQREDKVVAKGKGQLQTYWLLLDSGLVCDSTLITEKDKGVAPVRVVVVDGDPHKSSDPHSNFIEWNTEVIAQLLSNVVASRPILKFEKSGSQMTPESVTELGRSLGTTTDIRGEIADVIPMPFWAGKNTSTQDKLVDQETVHEIRKFVAAIAALYNDVPCK